MRIAAAWHLTLFERLTGNEIKKLFAELKKPPNTSQAPMGLACAGAPHVPEARGKRPVDIPKVESQPLMLMYRDKVNEPLLHANSKSGKMQTLDKSNPPVFETSRNALEPMHGYIRPPDDGFLPGFPTAERVRGKNPRQGSGNKPRARWKLPDGKILEWDYRHGSVEMWNKQMTKHLGEFDPETATKLKPADPGREIFKKFR